jgi:hypothetical protein
MQPVQQDHRNTTQGNQMNILQTTFVTAKAPEVPRYFHFSQNNPGGSFVIDETVAHHVIIQAHSAREANQRATDIGIYFDGCSTGQDCNCCGDRWSRAYGEGDETPLIYGDDPATHQDMFTKPGQPVCHVYHLDGSKGTYRKPEKETK